LLAVASQILSIDQLVTYLRKLLPADEKVATNEAEKKEVEVPKGKHDQAACQAQLLFSLSACPAGPAGCCLVPWLTAAAAAFEPSCPSVQPGLSNVGV
jgi:hypothetical protein